MNDAKFQELLLSPIGGVATGRIRSLCVFLFAAIATAIVVIASSHPTIFHIIGILFFAGMALAALWVFFSPRSFSFNFSTDGFMFKMIWRRDIYYWHRVSEFVIVQTGIRGPFKERIFFEDGSASRQAQFNRARFGYSKMVPYHYGFRTSQLAQLLNYWREQAIAAKN